MRLRNWWVYNICHLFSEHNVNVGLYFTGFQGNPYRACEDTNECENNPCGPDAVCLNTKGGFECLCQRGMTGDPYGEGCVGTAKQCRAADSSDCPSQLMCEGGQCVNPCNSLPCGANSVCEPEDHTAWCRCLPGFAKNADHKCVSVCAGVICADLAQCAATANGPTCKCPEGAQAENKCLVLDE